MIRAGALAVVVLALAPAPAAAADLSVPGAKRVAIRYARSVASVIRPAPTVRVYGCVRISSRTVDCTSTFTSPNGIRCRREVRVRRTSSGTHARFVGGLFCA